MKTYTLILLFVCLCFQHTAKCQDDWTLQKDKNGIKVFSRKSTKYKLDELKVETVFDGRLSQLAAIVLDVNNQHEWVYKTVKSQLLKEASLADIYYYTEIEASWPFNNRDVVVHMTIQQNLQNKIMTIAAKNINDYYPEIKRRVRIQYSRANWTVTPINSTQFKVEYQIEVDPGNAVPAWILNLFAANGPYDSFINLKEKIKLPQYQNAKFTFLTD